jgi:hypothetical protein
MCYDRPAMSMSLKPRTATTVLPTTRFLRTTRPTRPVPIMFRRLRRSALFGVSRLARFLIRRAHLEGITILQFPLSVQISGHSHIPSAISKPFKKEKKGRTYSFLRVPLTLLIRGRLLLLGTGLVRIERLILLRGFAVGAGFRVLGAARVERVLGLVVFVCVGPRWGAVVLCVSDGGDACTWGAGAAEGVVGCHAEGGEEEDGEGGHCGVYGEAFGFDAEMSVVWYAG